MFVLSEVHHILVASKPCSLVKELVFEVVSDFSILVLSLDFVKAYHFFPFRLVVVGEENLIIFSRRVNSFYFYFCQSFLTSTFKNRANQIAKERRIVLPPRQKKLQSVRLSPY